jgi:hypothetical protein
LPRLKGFCPEKRNLHSEFFLPIPRLPLTLAVGLVVVMRSAVGQARGHRQFTQHSRQRGVGAGSGHIQANSCAGHRVTHRQRWFNADAHRRLHRSRWGKRAHPAPCAPSATLQSLRDAACAASRAEQLRPASRPSRAAGTAATNAGAATPRGNGYRSSGRTPSRSECSAGQHGAIALQGA